jgi:hypothetical protein
MTSDLLLIAAAEDLGGDGVGSSAPRQARERATQAAGTVIRDWLKSHKPAQLIEHSIRMDGFGELLDHPQG